MSPISSVSDHAPEQWLSNARKWLSRSTPLLAIGLTSCSILAQLGVPVETTVADVQARPRIGWAVYLEGTVGDRAPLIGQQVYQLQDETGEIWVLTNQPPLPTGAPVRIRGTVRFESVAIAGQEQGELYIEETQRFDSISPR